MYHYRNQSQWMPMLNKRPPPDIAEEYEDPRYLDTRQFLMLQRLLQIRLVCHSSADAPKFAPAFSRLQRSMNVVVWLFAWLMPENVTERLDVEGIGIGFDASCCKWMARMAQERIIPHGILRVRLQEGEVNLASRDWQWYRKVCKLKLPVDFVAVISSQCFPLDCVAATCSVLAVWVWLSRHRSSNGRFFPD